MPRYRFRWEHLDARLLDALGRGLTNGDSPATMLRRRYGARPRTDFVAGHWATLRDIWLATDDHARAAVVESARRARLGDLTITATDTESQLRYLRTCRNQPRLRTFVLDALLASGEAHPVNVLPKRAEAAERAWETFERSLATALGALEPDQTLIVEAKDAPVDDESVVPHLRFVGRGAYGLHADASLADPAPLAALGWEPPAESDAATTPPPPPGHSLDFGPPVDLDAVAQIGTHTLRDALGIRHPSHLRYDAYDDEGSIILLPTLGLRRSAAPHDMPITELPAGTIPLVATPETSEELHAAVDQVLHTLFGGIEVVHDEDGDVPISFGSTNLYVRVVDDQPIVRLFVPLLVEVPESNDLYEALNEINRDFVYVRAHWADDQLLLTYDLPSFPFVGAHLVTAITAIGELADEIDDQLQERLGGRLLLGTTVARPPRESGGYL